MRDDEETPTLPGERLLLVGRVLFAVGLLAVLVVLVWALFGGSAPLVLALTALLAPVGFGLALAGLLRSLRHQRRVVSARLAEQEGSAGRAGVAR